MESLYINWNVSPIAFSMGHVHIRWYGLMLVLAFILSSIVFYTILRNEKKSLFLLPIVANALFLGALLGARLGHCLFYEFGYYIDNPLEIIFLFRDGEYIGINGLSSHGAGVGIIIAVYLLAKGFKMSFFYLMDRVLVSVSLGIVFIRIGNLFNSEVLGSETLMPWGFVFGQLGEYVARHPVQLYEAFAYVFVFIILYKLYKREVNNGIISGVFLILVFALRFVIEYFKAPMNDFDISSVLLTGQLLSLPCIFAGVVILIILKLKQRV